MIRDGIALFLIDKLKDADPPAGSLRGKLLEKLAIWEKVEKKHYPIENEEDMFERAYQLLRRSHGMGGEMIGDGFGNEWFAHCGRCGRKSIEVVRPGKAQCPYCD